MELASGVVIAERYRLNRQLGVGGMGSVWLAHDQLLDAACALKLIDDEKRNTEEVRIRLQREAKAAAQLRGPHVVEVFDHGIWQGTPYLAMEYLKGEDLGARLQRVRRLTADETHRFIAQVARALTRAHALGIVHRDLKPENIFLVQDDDGESAKVLDFGIARHHDYSLKDKTTKTGSFLGTPYYMSPEQARGTVIDHRSDLWSLGVIAFQCLTGRPPFESDALGALLGQIMYEPLPVPSAVEPSLSRAFDGWWQRAACRDREQRFSSAKELADALAVALNVARPLHVPDLPPRAPLPSLQDGAVTSATPIPETTAESFRGLLPSSELTPGPLSRTRGSRRARSSKLPLPLKPTVAAAGLLGLGIAGFLFVALQRPADAGAMVAPAEREPSAPVAAASGPAEEPPKPVAEPRVEPAPSAVADAADEDQPIPAEALPLAAPEDEAEEMRGSESVRKVQSSSSPGHAPVPSRPKRQNKLHDSADYGI